MLTDSGAGHDSRDDAMSSMLTVRQNAPNAELLEIDTAAFELHEDEGEWRWRLLDADGTSLAESAVPYPSRRAASDALNAVKEFGSDSTIEVAR